MTDSWTKLSRFIPLISIVFLAFAVSGCDSDDGKDGADGIAGADGADGINCWDLNGNGINDPNEDINGDGLFDAEDCNALTGGAYGIEALHIGYFTDHDYEGTESCLDCHGLVGQDMLTKGHFTWEGVASNITGFEGEIHGKNDLINNFCIAVPTNEGRCTQCHAGYGYADDTFDFGDPKNIDCLVCHDQTGTYAKAPKTAGNPVAEIGDPPVPLDLNVVAQSVAQSADLLPGDKVPIDNCIDCHAKAGGGDNVKHGDLSMSLANTTREFDVHMGTDGANFECVKCHQVERDMNDNLLSHGIGGMPYHSVDEGVMVGCVDCHADRDSVHAGSSVVDVLNQHPTLACQVCHIPTFARDTSTKVEWYWSDAGQDIDPVPVDPATNRATYDKKKGTFVWANNVRPTLRYFDGMWNRSIIEANDSYDPNVSPVVLGEPSATYQTPGAMIYPFKKMVGNQVADTTNNLLLVPHLFGMKGGPNPYWAKFDWDLALQDGAAYTNRPYSGDFGFVDTAMYLTVNHEVAPKEQALGNGGDCTDCHTQDQLDWTELGYSDDPILGGTRP